MRESTTANAETPRNTKAAYIGLSPVFGESDLVVVVVVDVVVGIVVVVVVVVVCVMDT